MNAIRLIKQDHQKVNQLFDQFDQMVDRRTAWQLCQQIRQELEAHAHMEETAFYPMFQEREGFKEWVDQSLNAHQEMKDLLQDLIQLGGRAELEALSDKMGELQDCVDHHVDEEEREFLPRVERSMNDAALDQLGRRLEDVKRAYYESAAKAA